MPRLLTHPEIDWQPDNTPVARPFGDVYFSAAGGLEESRAVFLQGCGLPEAWGGRQMFTVAETGFGTGLNFLALWQLWRAHRPCAEAQLSFVSFEGFPLARADAARALSAWPELAPLASRLLAAWPGPVTGVRQIRFEEDGVELILHLGEISQTLPRSRFLADAWFLDGFSPSRNAAMWQEDLYPLIAARSAPRARLASFTVAGQVRRGLGASGFILERRPGYGRKRERLEAYLPGPVCPAAAGPPGRVAILGAGIAGAALAAHLSRCGVRPVVFDPAPGPADAASGNRLALVMPRLDVGDTPEARLLIDAYLAARASYAGQPAAESLEVFQQARSQADLGRFARLAADPPLPPEELEIRPDGLLHRKAVILRPRALIEAMLAGADCRFGSMPQVDLELRRVDGESFDAVVLASGLHIARLVPGLQLTGRLGQVEYCTGLPEMPARAWARGHYALQSGQDRLWGATFDPVPDDGFACVSEQARLRNLKGLEELAPEWAGRVTDQPSVSRASIRATTPDRLPLIGRAPDTSCAVSGQMPEVPLASLPGIYVVGGLGSRGFTWAPWAASIVCALMTGRPLPACQESLLAVDPARQEMRRRRREGAGVRTVQQRRS